MIRWLRDGTPIDGATGVSYVVVLADLDAKLSVEVTAAAEAGESPGAAVISSFVRVSNSPPAALDVAFIDLNGGPLLVGDVVEGNYRYDDVDGDAEGATQPRWLRDGTFAASGMQYTVTSWDSGHSLTFQVRPVAAAGVPVGNAVTSSALMVENSPPVANDVRVTVAGVPATTAKVGDYLFVGFRYSDADLDTSDQAIVQWQRDGEPIVGAMGSLYMAVVADSGASLTVAVTPVAQSGVSPGQTVTSAAVLIENSPPTAEGVGIVDDSGGDALEGDVLSGIYTYDDLDLDPEGASVFRWLRDGSPIDGAVAATYTLVAEDIGAELQFEVTPAATTGATPGTPTLSPPLLTGHAPVAEAVMVVDDNGGYAVVGDTLLASYDYVDAEGDPEGASAFRWLRDGVEISGASAASYALTEDDVAALIEVEVTPVATVGTSPGLTVGSAPYATGAPPALTAVARYADLDLDDLVDAGDTLVLVFDQPIVLDGASNADFTLAVSGDSFGAGAIVAAGPDPEEVTITLGTGAALTLLPAFSGTVTPGAASGVDVSGVLPADAIEGLSGIDAQSAGPVDVHPDFVDSGQRLGSDASGKCALGDLDGDGDLDLIVANWEGPNRVYFNDGAATFTDSGQDLGNATSYLVALGDLDGDGDLDLVVSNYAAPDRVYLNLGDGSFAGSGQALADDRSSGLALGDLDGDGDLDLATSSDDDQTPNRVYFNDGGGNFIDSGQDLGSAFSRDVVMGDLDGDGDLDLVIGNRSWTPSWIFLNDGAGGLAGMSQEFSDQFINALSLGLLDGDGAPDVFAAVSGPDRIYLNDGAGVLQDSGQRLQNFVERDLALGDVDGDGDLDAVIANTSVNLGTNRVYLNDGTATFSDSHAMPAAADASGVALGDLDGDGDLDLVLTYDDEEGLEDRILLNSSSAQ